MRQLGSVSKRENAETLSDFLLAKGIENQILDGEKDDQFEIWILNQDHLNEAKTWYDQFQHNPHDEQYSVFIKKAKKIKKEEAQELKQPPLYQDARTTVFYRNEAGFGPITMFLMGLSLIITIFSNYGEIQKVVFPLYFSLFSNGLPEILHGQIWRLITPIFIHFDWLHLFFNMIWLFDLGNTLESKLGKFRFLALILISAMISNFAQYLMSGPYFGGMSGVVYALLGYLWMRGKYDPNWPYRLPQTTVYFMLGWLVLCLTGLVGSIANTAHVVGLIAGSLWGFISSPYWHRWIK
jgi:GlpG protein